MPTAGLAPLDEAITIEELTRDPYPIYKRLAALPTKPPRKLRDTFRPLADVQCGDLDVRFRG
jgi:hypothetical protein